MSTEQDTPLRFEVCYATLRLADGRELMGCTRCPRGIPWRAPDDMRHFLRLVRGRALVLGGATAAAMGRPVTGATTIAISRGERPLPEGVRRASSIVDALESAGETVGDLARDIPVVGGGAKTLEDAAELPGCIRVWHSEIEPTRLVCPHEDAARVYLRGRATAARDRGEPGRCPPTRLPDGTVVWSLEMC